MWNLFLKEGKIQRTVIFTERNHHRNKYRYRIKRSIPEALCSPRLYWKKRRPERELEQWCETRKRKVTGIWCPGSLGNKIFPRGKCDPTQKPCWLVRDETDSCYLIIQKFLLICIKTVWRNKGNKAALKWVLKKDFSVSALPKTARVYTNLQTLITFLYMPNNMLVTQSIDSSYRQIQQKEEINWREKTKQFNEALLKKRTRK